MEKLDLSSYAKDIKHNYDAVVSGDNTYAIFTTLKDSSLKPTVLGDGDIQEFVSEFEEGAVQFGIIGVNPFGSDVKKLLLLGWCPDSAPIKSKVSYAQNLSAVGKVLHYHVEVTARDSDDLDVDDLLKTVSNASGARYSIQSLTPQKSASSSFKQKPKPVSASSSSSSSSFVKPKPAVSPSIIKPKPSLPPKKEISGSTNDWGDDGEIKERDFSKEPLENLPSAYKPTKVDINALRNGPGSTTESEMKTISINPSGGLTSLPKPKPSHSVLSRFNQEVVKPEFGTKTPSFGSNPSKDSSKLVGGLSRNFGAENGKTPAQLWAEKKGQYKEVPNNDKPVNAEDIEKEVDHEDISLNSAKAKFEKLHLEAEKEEEVKKPITSSISSFPPPPARNEPVKQFPPPPSREEEEEEEEEKEETSNPNLISSFPPPPKRDVFSKFEEKPAEDKEDDDWGDDDADSVNEQHKSFQPPASSTAPAPLPVRPIPAAPVQEDEPATLLSSSAGGKHAIAEYDYEKDEDNEIGFTEGEKIVNIEFVDEDWWQGTNSKGETGLFPASYVNLIEASSSAAASSEPAPPTLPSRDQAVEEAKSSGLSAVAEYDYDATEENELTFKEGDIITDIDKVDDDWWLGKLCYATMNDGICLCFLSCNASLLPPKCYE
ncbi:hypothetical protein PICMEDRAFT_15290 [Pichia membranifaciens NRRL Y-2026]|uniref:Actin-binding protein n=1 Tax=Pichia membranifaciens NRRL Y-2026 TaxID=763406 RepID=A0A1E3NMJ6_9ASCO|nr:hypothetical protein PICMEDRAFT_15290 [Pichia membranifaciens NRRL Y-2026]ODQ47321.1 hypothetical protein PICMEDRAFT_15290 [Pichia membranifaciens NRRL Y-2026]